MTSESHENYVFVTSKAKNELEKVRFEIQQVKESRNDISVESDEYIELLKAERQLLIKESELSLKIFKEEMNSSGTPTGLMNESVYSKHYKGL